jgi:phosphoesterase RecJ-like protein
MKMTKSTLTRNDFQRAVELINGATSCLVATHTKPDGDAAGCCVALSEALLSLGKKVQMLLLSPMPQWYGFLFEKKVPVLGQDITLENLSAGGLGRFDLIVIVDTNSLSQLPKLENYLKQKSAPVLVIDHHATADGLGDVELVDAHAPAASSIVFDLLKFARWPVTPKIAQAIYVGIATDTGWFHFNNTSSAVFRACAELAELGANPSQIYHSIYQSFSPQRFHLMTAMLNTLQLHFDGRCATQYLTQQDFKNSGAKYEDTENLIDECQRIGSVEVSSLFVELPDGRIRCSLRSRGAIDVCKIAQKFGGGGHPSAAGTYLPAPIDNAKMLILAEVKKCFEQ